MLLLMVLIIPSLTLALFMEVLQALSMSSVRALINNVVLFAVLFAACLLLGMLLLILVTIPLGCLLRIILPVI